MTRGLILLIICAAGLISACAPANDEPALIAVATNFRTTFEKLETVFEAETDYKITQVNGATGSLYAQIRSGAPYHAFLAADQARPQILEETGFASRRFTYATGELVVWQTGEVAGPRSLKALLSDPAHSPIAIPNPELAPYGRAAKQVLDRLEIDTENRLVMGANVGQAFALISSGNAKIGLVAKTDALQNKQGSMTPIDPNLYAPIRQDGVILRAGENHAATTAFLTFLQSAKAKAIIQDSGYVIESGAT